MEPLDLASLDELPPFVEPFWIDEIAIDSREISSKHSLFIPLQGKRHDGHSFILDAAKRGAKAILVQKGRPLFELPTGCTPIYVNDPLEALHTIAKGYRKMVGIPVLAIGGAVGKTLVKDFLSDLLRKKFQITSSPESFNSQIGIPLSLLKIKKGDKVALIEAAISEPHEIEKISSLLEPTFTLLTPLDPLPVTSFKKKEWQEEWIKLLRTTKGGWNLLPISLKGDFSVPSSLWSQKGELPHAVRTSDRSTREIPYLLTFPSGRTCEGVIRGNYSYFLNIVNMAIKASYLLGLPEELIEEGIRSASLELMRTEIFRSSTGTTILNAPYSSDPQSVISSLRSLSASPKHHQKHLLFGGLKGEGRAATLKRVGESIASSPVDRLTLYGARDFSPLLTTLKEKGFSSPIDAYPTLEEALSTIKKTFFHDQTLLLKGPTKVPLEKLIELVNESPSHNICLIHLSSLRHNLSYFRSIAPKKRLLVMIKAQGYGTDDWQLAKFLEKENVDLLGLSYVDEAVSLKRAGVKQELFVLNATPYEAEKVAKFDLQVGVGDLEILTALETAAAKRDVKLRVHLHIDTGMSRFGCPPEKALEIAEKIKSSKFILLEGLMTHLSVAENPQEDPFTRSQVETFNLVRAELRERGHSPPWVHLSNSAGLLRFPEIEENMARLGLSIFGLHPSTETYSLPLKPAVSLQSKIVGINICKKGAPVSYGRSYVVEREEAKIAVLPIGYYDGLHRHYSGKGYVIVRGQKAPMVGKICMDYMMVDVSDIEGATVGDPVLLFGSDDFGHVATPEAFSAQSQGDIHELVTCLGPRIPRIFIEE